MIILILLVAALVAVAFFLSGEGDSYGSGSAGHQERRKFSTSDKNYFL
ncbi:MAG: hypothetical protein KDD41_06230 [Flavobacteriales bacterium]|nr:hypothetical protein [Flavobacteriales bacterium]